MKRKAFTLIELLTVIAIIALLLAILAPSVGIAIKMTRAAICRTNLGRLGEAFLLSRNTRAQKEAQALKVGYSGGLYPKPMLWPHVPNDVVEELGIFKCPDDDMLASSPGSLADLEYECEHGRFALDGPGSYETMYKARRGKDPEGEYTEFLFQDDYSGQYNSMSFNGWVDTDGGCRVYDSGEVLVFGNIAQETVGSVPSWSGAHGGYPTGINTCMDKNNFLCNGEGPFGGNHPKQLQYHRGETHQLPDWGEAVTNYGINSNVYMYIRSGVVVLADFDDRTIINIDNPAEAEELLVKGARHLGTNNYLTTGGSVMTAAPMAISPRLRPDLWTP